MKKIIILFILFFLTAIISHTVLKSHSDFNDEDCEKCHIDHINNPKLMKAPITQLCIQCHKNITLTSSHPVDIYVVSAKIPPGLPLEEKKITCNTCHNIHENRFTSFGKKTFYLRVILDKQDFCMLCHDITLKENKHAELISIAHQSKRYVVTRKDPVDPLSLECISCHDGITSKNASFELTGGIWRHKTNSHPIGSNYRRAQMRKGNLVPIEKLNKNVQLFNGRLGCCSCHSIYSKNHSLLVINNSKSELCFACHIK